MKKILYIAPHLSTGGLPQYLVKKIELLKGEFEIYLVEWVDCTGGRLVIQRNKILELVDSNKFFTLQEDKTKLLSIIEKISPDIIHIEEIPEYFMDNDIALKIYNPKRKYFIIETSHDSSFDTTQKRFFPDKFMFVSDWQIKQYKDINIPKVLVEYPIEYVERPNREEALIKLGLDPNKKHILHVGLFTPRKNQKEFFEYAKLLPEYEFHCLGNHADNFKYYWEPLMDKKPSNLTWWDERRDVDNFYSSMDLFLFTSRGTDNDKETMPLVIREAISYQIPTLIYNLPVYLNYFDKFDIINYLKPSTNNQFNIDLINSKLSGNIEKSIDNEVFIISTYPVTDSIIKTTEDCINSIKQFGYKVILTSHVPIPESLQELADYCVYDKNNILTKHTFYTNSWLSTDKFEASINLQGENNDVYHGPTVYTNYYNGAAMAHQLGFSKAYYINYDYILNSSSYIEYISDILKNKNIFFGEHQSLEGKTLITYFFASRPLFLIETLDRITTPEQYDKLMSTYGSESNGLENLFYHIFKNCGGTHFEKDSKFAYDSERYFDHRDFSRVEYFTVLPTNIPNYLSPWVQISNSKESLIIQYKVHKNEKLIIERTLEVKQKFHFWDMIYYELEDKIHISFEVFNLTNNKLISSHSFNLDSNYYNNILPNNGMFKSKEYIA